MATVYKYFAGSTFPQSIREDKIAYIPVDPDEEYTIDMISFCSKTTAGSHQGNLVLGMWTQYEPPAGPGFSICQGVGSMISDKLIWMGEDGYGYSLDVEATPDCNSAMKGFFKVKFLKGSINLPLLFVARGFKEV